MALKFSQRVGITPSVKKLQMDSIDDDLKHGLWNVLKIFVIDQMPVHNLRGERTYEINRFASHIWHDLRKLPVDQISRDSEYHVESKIREWFYAAEWFEVYNLIDFVAGMDGFVNLGVYIEQANVVLSREFSAWRFIDGSLAPISNSSELDAISQALDATQAFTALDGANVHLTKALALFSDRVEPDYGNAIKESIQAVEAVLRKITGETTLGKAFGALEASGLKINGQVRSAFEKLYAWTNNKDSGIRHAIVEIPNEPDFDDAKFMLVTCSAFVNFIIGKANKSGISLG
ncbi:MAG: hypothetical protein ABI432_05050 [Flavobacteriales bacterium]